MWAKERSCYFPESNGRSTCLCTLAVYVCLSGCYSRPFKVTSGPIEHVWGILRLLYDAWTTLRLKKAQLFRRDHRFSKRCRSARPPEAYGAHYGRCRQTRAPHFTNGIMLFLGLSNVFKRFVANFARLAASLKQEFEERSS